MQPQLARTRAHTRGAVGGNHDHHAPGRFVTPLDRRGEPLGRLHVHAATAQRGVGVGDAVEGAARSPHAAEHADEVPHVPVGRRAMLRALVQMVEQLIEACVPAPQVVGGEVGDQRHRALETGDQLEQAVERVRRPWTAVGDRRKRSPGEPLDRVHHPRGRCARHSCILDERQRQPVVAPPRFAVRQVTEVRRRGDYAPRRQRHHVLVDRLACRQLNAGRAQRQRAAEGSAQVIALG